MGVGYGGKSSSSKYDFDGSKDYTAIGVAGGKTKTGKDGKPYFKLKFFDRDTRMLYVVRIYNNVFKPTKGDLAGKECIKCYVTAMKRNSDGMSFTRS